ncbi:unnamed protein product, partial [Ectocarpus sp. 8 AP-2014]
LDKAPGTEDSAVATKALSRDVGKDCTSPVCTAPDGPVIKDGDFLLGTAPLGQVIHYIRLCAREAQRPHPGHIQRARREAPQVPEESAGHPDQAG